MGLASARPVCVAGNFIQRETEKFKIYRVFFFIFFPQTGKKMETRTGQSVERQLRNVLVKWVWAWPSGRCPVHNKSTKWRNRRVFLSFGEATAKLIIFKFPAIFTPLQHTHTHTHTNTTINSNDWPFEIRFFRSEQKWKMLKNKFSTKRGTFFLSKSHKIPATQFRNSGIYFTFFPIGLTTHPNERCGGQKQNEK